MQAFPIIEKLGGREAVFDLLNGQPEVKMKSLDTIRMWIQRGSIPGAGQRALMAAADQRGISYDASDFTPAELPEPEPKPVSGEAA